MKKNILLVAAISITLNAIAQISNLGINYQAQVRNNAGVLIPDSLITLRFQLLPNQFSTIPLWQEEHNATTDNYGIASVVIGKGKRTAGKVSTFDSVDFSSANLWIKVEIKSGSNFIALSQAEPFQSVPYAKAAGNAVLFPAGFIMPFAGDSTKIPQGWLLCDGREISRSNYANLYSVIGDNWGRGNNITTFNLPDLRGQFLRGVSYNSGVDPDNSSRNAKYNGGNIGNRVGSYQGQEIQNHNHSFAIGNFYGNIDGGSSRCAVGCDWNQGRNTNSSGGNETRPKNAYVNFLIKF
jgi:hypothetical protein